MGVVHICESHVESRVTHVFSFHPRDSGIWENGGKK